MCSRTHGYLSFIGPGEGARPRSDPVPLRLLDRCEGLRIDDHGLALHHLTCFSNARDHRLEKVTAGFFSMKNWPVTLLLRREPNAIAENGYGRV